MKKERVDILLVERGLTDSREKAKRLIMTGEVFSKNERMDKPGTKIDKGMPLHIKNALPYVGRGGFKLEKALETFDISVKNKTIVDVGASTGGFTDCALQNGATYIYAVDVGYNQLDWKLRSHAQVSVHERTNFRYVSTELFENGLPNFAMMDVSFISIKRMLPVLKKVLTPNSDVVTLIKPQFEAKKEDVGKKGVIRNKKIHADILKDAIDFALGVGFSCEAITYSPITGGEGNMEFLAHLKNKDNGSTKVNVGNVEQIVNEAHTHFNS